MALAQKQKTSRSQQQHGWNDNKQFLHRHNLHFKKLSQVGTQNQSHGGTHFPVGRTRLPRLQKPAQAGFYGLLPLVATLPMAGRCQDPASSQTGRLADDCASNRPALTAGGHRSSFPQGEQTSHLDLLELARIRVCGVMARSMLPPIFCAMLCICPNACRRSCGS